MLDVAEKFFWPCDEGKWPEACKEFCHANATFKTDADTIVPLDKLEDYVEWMKDVHSMMANVKFEFNLLKRIQNEEWFCYMLLFMETTFWVKNPNQSKRIMYMQ